MSAETSPPVFHGNLADTGDVTGSSGGTSEQDADNAASMRGIRMIYA
jgi:hypothetical protein